jgi:hypothetical protein
LPSRLSDRCQINYPTSDDAAATDGNAPKDPMGVWLATVALRE